MIPKREAQNLKSRNSFHWFLLSCSIHESQVCQEEKKKEKKRALDLPPFNSLAEGERWCKLSHSLLTELLTQDTTELDCEGKNPCKWQNRKGVSLEAALSFIASLYNYTLPFKAVNLWKLSLQPVSLSQALGKVHHSHSLPNPNTFRSSISKYGSTVRLLGERKKRLNFFSMHVSPEKLLRFRIILQKEELKAFLVNDSSNSLIFFLPFWDHQSNRIVFACIS